MRRLRLRSRLRPAHHGSAAVLGAAVLVLLVSGCDMLEEPQPITLPPITETVRFQFEGGELPSGTATRVAAVQPLDLRDDLRALQVAPSEVIAARVTEVQLERRQPLTVDLGFLDAATLLLVDAGTSLAVARMEGGLPASSRTPLPVLPADAASLVAGSGFEAALELTPQRVVDDAFVLEARVTFVVQVEGV